MPLAADVGKTAPEPNLHVTTTTLPKEARSWVKLCREKDPVLAEVELHVFRGATLYVLLDSAQQPLSYNVTRFGKRKKNVWEPYANWYTAYTILAQRRRGHARTLALRVRQDAVSAGCVRLKALAGTRLGLLLHAGLGDQFWGLTPKGEAVVDTPLVPNPAYIGRNPPNATTDEVLPWDAERVLQELAGAPLYYDRKGKREGKKGG